MSDLITLPANAITLNHGIPMTTSLVVAETFEKQHKHVLRDIDALDCSPEFARSNFGPADFIDKNGDHRRMFEITRNGFIFLAMGYRGPKAALMKEAYISRFDAMAAALTQGHHPDPVAETVTLTLTKDDYIRHLEHKLGHSYRMAAPAVVTFPPAPARAIAARPVTAEDTAIAVRMFTAGASKGAIGRAIQRSHSTVRRILDRATQEKPHA